MRVAILALVFAGLPPVLSAQYTQHEAESAILLAKSIYIENDMSVGEPEDVFSQPIPKQLAKTGRFSVATLPEAWNDSWGAVHTVLMMIFSQSQTEQTISYRNSFGGTITEPVLQICMTVYESKVLQDKTAGQNYVLWNDCRVPSPIYFPDNMASQYRGIAMGEFKAFIKYFTKPVKQKKR